MSNKSDNHSQKMVQLDQQYVSYVVAAFLLVSFFIFLAGYYWGKKQALEPLAEQFTSDSLADKIYCALYEELPDTKEPMQPVSTVTQQSEDRSLESLQEEIPEVVEKTDQWYYARIAGFGSLKAARACVDKLSQKGVKTRIVERLSKTVRGSLRKWYQVVSYPYKTREEVTSSIQVAQRYIKLHNVTVDVLTEEQRNNLFGKEERHNA